VVLEAAFEKMEDLVLEVLEAAFVKMEALVLAVLEAAFEKTEDLVLEVLEAAFAWEDPGAASLSGVLVPFQKMGVHHTLGLLGACDLHQMPLKALQGDHLAASLHFVDTLVALQTVGETELGEEVLHL
jgi:hypothetical protein